MFFSIALSSLQTSFLSTVGSLKSNLAELVTKPTLESLREIGSYLVVDVYQFFIYSAHPDRILMCYVLFNQNLGFLENSEDSYSFSSELAGSVMRSIGF